MHRLFVALRPPPDVRRHLMTLMDGVLAARWQADEQLHVTLRFIGAVDRRRAEDIAAALSGLAAPVPNVALAGVGVFDQRGRVDTLWAGLAPVEPLAALHRKVDRAMVGCGLEPERRAYRPHVTLARLSRTGGDPLEIARWRIAHAGLASERFALPHLVLFESHLGHDGAGYEPVARWPLG